VSCAVERVPTWAQGICEHRRVLRVIVIAVLAACSGSSRSSHSQAPPPRRVITPVAGAPAALPFTSECVAPNDPALADVQKRATAATQQAFDAELARNKLRVIALGRHEHQLAEGLSYEARGAPEGKAVRQKLDTAEGTFVAAETQWSGNPGSPPAWEFVQDERGDVFRLMRKPLAAITPARICTCREQRCGPPGSGCPACGSTNQTMYGPLPKGAEYRGEIEVAYQANVVSLEYKEQGCPGQPVCEQPP
jgi:hypothetical protein